MGLSFGAPLTLRRGMLAACFLIFASDAVCCCGSLQERRAGEGESSVRRVGRRRRVFQVWGSCPCPPPAYTRCSSSPTATPSVSSTKVVALGTENSVICARQPHSSQGQPVGRVELGGGGVSGGVEWTIVWGGFVPPDLLPACAGCATNPGKQGVPPVHAGRVGRGMGEGGQRHARGAAWACGVGSCALSTTTTNSTPIAASHLHLPQKRAARLCFLCREAKQRAGERHSGRYQAPHTALWRCPRCYLAQVQGRCGPCGWLPGRQARRRGRGPSRF